MDQLQLIEIDVTQQRKVLCFTGSESGIDSSLQKNNFNTVQYKVLLALLRRFHGTSIDDPISERQLTAVNNDFDTRTKVAKLPKALVRVFEQNHAHSEAEQNALKEFPLKLTVSRQQIFCVVKYLLYLRPATLRTIQSGL